MWWFLSYVSHQILRHHHDITNEGKATIPNSSFPQNFLWQAQLVPAADWHGTTLSCTIVEGNTKQVTSKQLDVQFSPRFYECDDRQHVDANNENSTIECSFGGNPTPTITWLRATDNKSLTPEQGIIIEKKMYIMVNGKVLYILHEIN